MTNTRNPQDKHKANVTGTHKTASTSILANNKNKPNIYISQLFIPNLKTWQAVLRTRITYPDLACHFDADPNADSDPACHFDADPDPDHTFHFDADPDPDPSFQIKAPTH